MDENSESPTNHASTSHRPEDMIQKKIENVLAQKMTRRHFLRRAPEKVATAVIAAPIIIKAIEKTIYDGLRAGLTSPGISDSMISAINTISEHAPNSENIHARPMLEIINEGIQNFQKESNQEVVYNRSKDYKDLAYYADTLEEASSGIGLHHPKTVIDTMKKSLPEEVKEAYVFSDTRSTQFLQLFPRGSGFFDQIRQRHPDIFDEKDNIVNYGKYYSKVSEVGKDIMT